jgi:N-acetylglucosaminyldiphosphoundecaprenol N-acetyl-beta-D-mannosaminyltransferase
VDPVTKRQAVDLILQRALDQKPGAYACLTNVNTVVLSQGDGALREAVEQSFLSLPDGIPLVWILRRDQGEPVEKVAGADLMTLLTRSGRDVGLRHFIYAWSSGQGRAAARGLRRLAPNASIVGIASPPFAKQLGVDELITPPWIDIGSPVEDADWDLGSLQQQVSYARPHVLWVGLGSPLQDRWMAMAAGQLNVPLMIGVGRALSYVAGTRRRCPSFMVDSGLEWVWTLATEPTRLWRRYLVGNLRFAYLLARSERNLRRARSMWTRV